MRLRFAVPVSLMATFAFAAAPAVSLARHFHHPPQHNRGITIRVTENQITAGDSIGVYGEVRGTQNAGQLVNLYQHVAGGRPGYHFVAQTKTVTGGDYEFSPLYPDSNRCGFVRLAGTAANIHSRTICEGVRARVTIHAPSTAFTGQPVPIVGHVVPNHAHEIVILERQVGQKGDDFRKIAATRLNGSSNYGFLEQARIPGDYTLRVVFRGDKRNRRGVSDDVSIAVSQKQNPGFTLNASADPITVGQSDTLSGTLAASAAHGNANVAVTLFERTDGTRFRVAQNGTTDSSGNYTFTVQPANNTVYAVRTTDGRHTRQLFIGVRDSVTIMASSTSSTVGGSVTFTGTVAPSKVGHVVELQRQGPEGEYFTVARTRLNNLSSYSFTHTFGSPGTKTYRVRETGSPENEGSVSPSVTITVSQTAISSLPPAS